MAAMSVRDGQRLQRPMVWHAAAMLLLLVVLPFPGHTFAAPEVPATRVFRREDVFSSPLCTAKVAPPACRGARSIGRHSGNSTSPTMRNGTLEVIVTFLVLLGASLGLSYIYPAVEALGFRSKFRELLFSVFTACSLLWFLAPSHWASRVSGRVRPQALRCSARGQKRLAAILLAFIDFSRFILTAAQGFFAARLAVEALPTVARRLLPFIPFNASFMTSDGALKLLGPWLGPVASIAAWMMELMSILINQKAWQFLLVLSAAPISRFLFRSLEPSPRDLKERPTLACGLREFLRTLLSSTVLFLGVLGALNLGGWTVQNGVTPTRTIQPGHQIHRTLPNFEFKTGTIQPGHQIHRTLPNFEFKTGRSLSPSRCLSVFFVTTAITLQALQNMLARAVIRVHRMKLEKPLKGFVGGCLLQGQLHSFQGLEAEISTDNGPVLIPAAVALKLAKSGASIASPECQVQVPVAGVMAGMEAAKKALNPKSKKAKIKKLLVLPMVTILGFLAMKHPSLQRFLYAFAVSMYFSAYVLPPPLVVCLPLVIFSFAGPIGSASSLGIAAGLTVSCLKQLLQKPARGAQVVCANLDLAQDRATLVWRGDPEVGTKVQEAATDEKAKESLQKHHKKMRIKGSIFCLISLILICGLVMWRPFVFSVEDAFSKVGARLLIFGLCSGLSLRLLQYAVIPQAARFALPSPLGALSAGPGKTVHWFLAVNSRTAAASAAAAFLLPRVGLVQKILYHTQLVHTVEWLDAWVFQISTAFLGCVLSVQIGKALTRFLSFRPSNSLLGMFMAVLKAMTLGSCSTVLTRCILLAVGAPGPSPAGAMANSIAVGVTIGFLALPFLLTQDWLSVISTKLWATKTHWVRRPDGECVPAKLLNFEGRHAVLQPFQSNDVIEVPSAELKGATWEELRPVRITIPVDGKAEAVEESLRFTLKQQVGLLQRRPLEPEVRVSEDRTSIQVTGFLERSVHPDQAREIRSSLLLAAANAAC